MGGCGVGHGDSGLDGTDGKLVNRDLAEVFVMGKKQGWGDQQTPDGRLHEVPRLPHAAGAERFRASVQ